ncbi:MAG: zf-HC2 domain-containing protein [Acidobacteria bacterium]|nr:zf-HC2 domain-containing protein [Acidobacteriota bacterium]MBI3654947.1 zf-HC2 domain-containing protein [Acidobacteriota bacterium]
MDCVECQENLSAHIENELPESIQEQVSRHLHACRRCDAEYQSLTTADQLVSDHFMIEASPVLWTRIEAEIRASATDRVAATIPAKPTPYGRRLSEIFGRFSWRAWAGAAASLGLALGLTFFVQQQRENHRLDQAIQSYIMERDKVEQNHLQADQGQDLANTDEYAENPFVIEDRHKMENPFKL